MSSTHTIVVLGGNVAGLAISHYILRHILPAAKRSTGERYRLVLVSPSTHYQYKIGAPRALSEPDLLPKAFVPFAEAFAGYGVLFEHIQGEAVALDPSSKVVTVSAASNGTQCHITYGSLIIATGVRSSTPLWSLHGPHTISANALRDTHDAIDKAKTILIVGGGATGVETAGEIASHWSNKEITLLSGSTGLLTHLKEKAIGKKAEAQLQKLKVKIEHLNKVTSAAQTASGKTLLNLSDRTTRDVDVYIDATGGTPNTAFLPAGWLDLRGRVNTDMSTLRVVGVTNVYSIGDVASYSKRSILDIHRAVAPLGYSLWADLTKGANVREPLTEKLYKQDEGDFQLVPIGPNGGVGTAFGFSFPSFMVKFAKSKTFFFEKVPDNVRGAAYTKINVSAMPG